MDENGKAFNLIRIDLIITETSYTLKKNAGYLLDCVLSVHNHIFWNFCAYFN